MPTVEHGERFIPLAGADNVRDLGGLPADGGRVTRRGLLLRGEFTPGLTEEDIELLVRRMGLRTVVDLRTRSEVRDAPGAFAESEVRVVPAPLPVISHEPLPGAEEDLLGTYLGFIEADPAPMLRAVRTLIDPADHPALFHCAAGKDRTGALSAIVLELLGVPREVNAQDYALTADRVERVFARLSELDLYRERLSGLSDVVRSADEATLVAFLEALDERHGGVHGWVRAQGIGEDELERFRDALLEDAG
jgi:protein tyrosine/serine phosphatase